MFRVKKPPEKFTKKKTTRTVRLHKKFVMYKIIKVLVYLHN